MQTKFIRFLTAGLAVLAIFACTVFSPSEEQGTPNAKKPGEGPVATPTLRSFTPAQNPPDAKVEGFFQDDGSPGYVYYCVKYTNKDESRAQFSSMFQTTAYDAGGNVLGTGVDMLGWIYPGQSLPYAGMMSLNSSGKVERIDAQVQDPGQMAAPPGGKNNPLTVEKAAVSTIGANRFVTGTVRNNLDQALLNVDVTALAYDAGGRLVDAAAGILPFVPAGEQTAVEVGLHVAVKPARVELYPYPGISAQFLVSQDAVLTVEKAGALLINKGLVEAVFVVKNSAARAYASSYYVASLYDAQGNALASESGIIPFIFPNGRAADTVRIPFSEEATVARLVVQVLPLPEDDPANLTAAGITTDPLAVSRVEFQPDIRQNDKVAAEITNASGNTINYFSVTAVLYDSGGRIVGGGKTSLVPLFAGEATEAVIPVDVKGEVADTEVIASIGDVSSLQAGSGPEATDLPLSVGPGGQIVTQIVTQSGAEAPRILSQWWAQPEDSPTTADYAFLVENPNPSLDLQNITFQATAYDDAGLVLNSNTGYIGLLPAGRSLGVVKTIVTGGDPVEKLDIAISDPGQPAASAGSPPALQAGQEKIARYGDEAVVSGVISNPLDREVGGVSVVALVFDSGGQIVGAGEDLTTIYSVPAGGEAAVAVKVIAPDTGVRAELYPSFQSENIAPPVSAGIQPLRLAASGFIQDPENMENVSVTFVVENPNPGTAVTDADWQVAVYDQTGALLATSSSGSYNRLPVLFPDGTTCKITYIKVPENSLAARAEVQLGQGQAVDYSGPGPLRSDKVTYFALPLPRVTGLILNTGADALEMVYVQAVAFDDAGRIVGWGTNRLDAVPANSKNPIEIPIQMIAAFSGDPARVEIYPCIETLATNP